MDIASTSAGAPPAVASPPPAKAPEKETTQPVKTEEPRAKAVQAETSAERIADRKEDKPTETIAESQAKAEDDFGQSATTPKVDRLFEVEPESETLIYKAVDAEDGEVVRQVPEDVILKLRATYNDNTPLLEVEPGTPRDPIDRIA
ncbi:MAG: flagellar protein FlaG [Hyphomicrobiales bacterium]